MSRLIEVDSSERERMCLIAKAISIPARVDIIGLLFDKPLSVLDISQQLHIPASTAGIHVKILEEAGIIRTEKKVLDGSIHKVCFCENHLIHFFLRSSVNEVNDLSSVVIPIGSYSDCYVETPCGLINETEHIGYEDEPRSFYMLERINAQIIWLSKGYIRYMAPNILPAYKKCKRLSLSMELCSEAYGYDENYKSDIYLSINGKDCGFYRSLGDYGARRGMLTPAFWQNGLSQYGKLVTWIVDGNGVYCNEEYASNTTIDTLDIENNNCIEFKIETRKNSDYCGGINIFGDNAGDYNQAIVLTIEH